MIEGYVYWLRSLALVSIMTVLTATTVLAQATSFTYQGKLTDGSAPANGNYDLQFTIWDSLSGGTQQPQPVTITVARSSVPVSGGIFTVQLDFGASAFPGADRFLEISVRAAVGGSFTVLTPRQKINSTPFAIRSLSASVADTATNTTQLGGVAADQYVVTSDSRLTDARSPTAGSANYIQNTTTLQAGSNFNVSGNGFIGGNLGVGTTTPQAPLELKTATDNYGITHTDGTTRLNTFINSFLGGAGGIGTQTNHPLFFYAGNAPRMIISPLGRIGIGTFDPQATFHTNGTGWFSSDTTPLPITAGPGVAVGYLGNSSGPVGGYVFAYDYTAKTGKNLLLNSLGGNVGVNTFFPQASLHVNGTSWFQGSNPTPLPQAAGQGVAIGTTTDGGYIYSFDYGQSVARNLLLNTPGGNVGIGTTTPQASFNVNGNSWFQGGTGQLPSNAGQGVSIGYSSGLNTGAVFAYDYSLNTAKNLALNSPGGNVGVGTASPTEKLTVQTDTGKFGVVQTDGNIIVGSYAGGGGGWYGTKTNNPLYFFTNFDSNPNAQITLLPSGKVGIGPGELNPRDALELNGIARILTYGAAGSISLCVNNLLQLASCSSSLRYKTNLAPYRRGLEIIKSLRPISFDWKDGGMHDLGLAAEDVARVEPLLVTHNRDGEIEGVKYDRISAVLVNAIKEQQDQIEEQQKSILRQGALLAKQQREIERLKRLVSTNRGPGRRR